MPGGAADESPFAHVASQIFLWSMVEATNTILLGHFLTHYQSLGIRLQTNAHICLQGSEEATRLAQSTLDGFAVANRSVAPVYSSKIKAGLVNSFLRMLPEDSWLVYPDADEMFHFDPPSKLAPLMAKHAAFCGAMLDRVASDLSLAPMRADVPLCQQFPVCTTLRAAIQSAVKLTLIRSRINGLTTQFHNSHSAKLMDANGTLRGLYGGIHRVGCANSGWLSHYQYSEDAYNLTLLKLHTYSAGPTSDRNNANVYRAQLALFAHNASTGLLEFSAHGAQAVSKYRKPCEGARLSECAGTRSYS